MLEQAEGAGTSRESRSLERRCGDATTEKSEDYMKYSTGLQRRLTRNRSALSGSLLEAQSHTSLHIQIYTQTSFWHTQKKLTYSLGYCVVATNAHTHSWAYPIYCISGAADLWTGHTPALQSACIKKWAYVTKTHKNRQTDGACCTVWQFKDFLNDSFLIAQCVISTRQLSVSHC